VRALRAHAQLHGGAAGGAHGGIGGGGGGGGGGGDGPNALWVASVVTRVTRRACCF